MGIRRPTPPREQRAARENHRGTCWKEGWIALGEEGAATKIAGVVVLLTSASSTLSGAAAETSWKTSDWKTGAAQGTLLRLAALGRRRQLRPTCCDASERCGGRELRLRL